MAPLHELPESFRNKYKKVMGEVSRKVREVCNQHLGESWLENHSQAFEYVLAQAECVGDYWPEERPRTRIDF